MIRVGYGYDAHRLSAGRRLILGGVEIPYERGLLGHSDADAAVHALIDALFGAAAMGDIGRHFPDTDARWKDADSISLLRQAAGKLRSEGYNTVNADITIIAQRPKLAPYMEKMRENIAAAIGTDAGRVNVKATTEEGMGFSGSGEGIAAHAVCV
ncbi:MAG: 2-C-methyl-D-erythritol 2,4-cyclodiphosphate synthase, partial [Oscillospiraceae bacterium]|nr:2-C-methyl-D-erythritol 2,4-cyclodiphosphate synthase [Oscillospiraceae bacterium]